jgi:tetratricopeptide (TPR) repeat protein
MVELKAGAVHLSMRVAYLICAASVCAAQQTTAEKLIAAGHWKEARTLVEARIREAPKDPLATFLLSQIRNAFGEHTTPLPLAEKAVALDGAVAKYHRQLAEVLGVVAQHSNTLQQVLLARRFRKEIETALTLDPTDVQALRDLLEFHLIAPGLLGGDQRKAAAISERIAALDAAEGYLAKARIAAYRKQSADAEALTWQAVEVLPPSYRARIALAQLCIAREGAGSEAAEAQAKAALKLDSSRADAHAILASIYAARADWSALDAALGVASRQVASDAVPYYRAAERLLATGRDLARAERYLRIYLGQEPEGNEPTLAEARSKLTLVLQSAAPKPASRELVQ